MTEYCPDHTKLYSKIEVIDTKLDAFFDRVSLHIEEGDKAGGFRDRLIFAETSVKLCKAEISTLKKNRWLVGIVSGLVGGLVSQLSPELVNLIIRIMIRQ